MLAVSLSFGIFFGRTCELYGHRVITITGAVIWVSALIAASFCSSVPALIATQGLLLGVGGALLFVSGTAGQSMLSRFVILVLRKPPPLPPFSNSLRSLV